MQFYVHIAFGHFVDDMTETVAAGSQQVINIATTKGKLTCSVALVAYDTQVITYGRVLLYQGYRASPWSNKI